MTHDYKRIGTATQFAALNLLDGQVISQCQQRHRCVEWYATHKHPKVRHCPAKHPRIIMRFTPTSALWLNVVEQFFRDSRMQHCTRSLSVH